MKTIHIDLPGSSYRYQVKIGSDCLSKQLKELLGHYREKRIFLVNSQALHTLYPDAARSLFPAQLDVMYMTLPDGEQTKTLASVSKILDFLVEHDANRRSLLVAFGGGVIGDTAGLAAALFMRGIGLVQVPTTLLSMVDSGIGGKTGINHKAGKNLIGAFKQPLQTIIDVSYLETLPEREFIAGYAELIKHGFIRDSYLFQLLNQRSLADLRSDKDLLIESIFRSCEVKARVVEADEKENDQRAILNFGHTFGHFLEAFTHYEILLHGEAVIIGMDFAAWWSTQHGYLDPSDYRIIHDHLRSLSVIREIPEISRAAFTRIIQHDKKSSTDGIRFVGLTGIGQARVFDGVRAEGLWDTLQTYIEAGALIRTTLVD